MSVPNPYLVVGILSAITTAVTIRYLNRDRQTGNEDKMLAFQDQLGIWKDVQSKQKHQTPLGPQITATLQEGFCGFNDVLLSRIPHGEFGSSSWSIVFSLIRKIEHELQSSNKALDGNKIGSTWLDLPLETLIIHESKSSIKISRATLMTLFALTNARRIYSYSSAAGYRSAYPSYCGQWSIAWPIGKPCEVKLSPHDSHIAKSDVYPPSFSARIDKCVEMMAGIISNGDWKVAFPGRAKHDGSWILEHRPHGFGGAHGSRHLYNMQGGKVFEVGLLAIVPGVPSKDMMKIQIPALSPNNVTFLHYNLETACILNKSLNCLPWSSLSWSLHRGLKDVLLAYGKSNMDFYRTGFGALLRNEAALSESALVKKGWAPDFVHKSIPVMAESAILAGIGNGGDLVRIVVGVVECLLERTGIANQINLDRTEFWDSYVGGEDLLARGKTQGSVFAHNLLLHDSWTKSDLDTVVALTKFFVLEWSQELDYQLYHDLPVDVFLM